MGNKTINAAIITEVCNGTILCGNKDTNIETFSNDTRNIQKGGIYIAIKGENINGNLLIEDAFNKGAIGAIVDEEPNEEVLKNFKDKVIIKVDDTVNAIQKLAKYKRSLYDIPVIAITGSVGKTSTKDMIASVLKQKYNVLYTKGNLNNHIGLPLTLLGLNDHDAIVVEMGMNHFGEIRTLTNIAMPTIAIIINVGTAHIGNLGSRENILKAKLEILEGLQPGGSFIINNDNDLLNKWLIENNINNKVITYGINNKSDYMPNNIEEETTCESKYLIDIEDNKYEITVPVAGKHFIYNSLCAIAIGKLLNMPMDLIANGIKNTQMSAKRMNIIKLENEITIIDDCYNASFDSMKGSLEVLGKMKDSRKIAILGDMLELGEFSESLHEKVGEEVVKNNIDILITVGNFAKCIASKASKLGQIDIYTCENNDEALQIIHSLLKEKDVVLVKASNGMKFGEIIENLKGEFLHE